VIKCRADLKRKSDNVSKNNRAKKKKAQKEKR